MVEIEESEDFPRGTLESTETTTIVKGKRKGKITFDKEGKPVGPSANYVAVNKYASVWTQPISTENLSAGCLVLGCVRSVKPDNFTLELPDGLHGIVNILGISDAYGSLTNKPRLTELFRPGQLLCGKVESIPDDVPKKLKIVKMTVNPREINESLVTASLKEGLVIQAAVKSVEDNGYVMDVGNPSVTAFLPSKSVGNDKLAVGQVLLCCVQKAKEGSRVLQLSVDQKFIDKIVSPAGLRLDQMIPGQIYNCAVVKSIRVGLFVRLNASALDIVDGAKLKRATDDTFFIQRRRLTDCPAEHLSAYAEGTELKVVVLYAKPNSKMVGLSAQPYLMKLTNSASRGNFLGLKEGDLVDAETMEVTNKKGIYFRLHIKEDLLDSVNGKGEVFGYAPASQLHVGAADVAVKYSIGSRRQCRVIGFNFMQNLAMVSTKKKVLNQPVVSVEAAKVGLTVKATVTRVIDAGVTVRVCQHIKGWIPLRHVADVIPTKPLTHPNNSGKFPIGSEITVKIWAVDLDRQQLVLTHKRSLLESELAIVSSYDSSNEGAVADGMVVKVDPKGILVIFYQDVQGWLPLSRLQSVGVQNPKENFHVGQVVRVRLLKVDSANKKIQLDWATQAEPMEIQQKPTLKSDVSVFEAKVTSVSRIGLYVEIQPGKAVGFIPNYHLSDSIDNWELLAESYQVGDKIPECLMFSEASVGPTIVTCKPAMIAAHKEGGVPRSFEELEVGMLVCGVVARVHPEFGYFVDFTGNLCGLCPYGSTDRREMPYKIGQTVVGRIQQVNLERNRFSISLKLRNCFTPPTLTTGMQLLRAYLKERQTILSHFAKGEGLRAKLTSMQPGQIVKVVVEQVNANGAICKVSGKSGLKGVITQQHMGEATVAVGSNLHCVVLDLDLEETCLELSCLPSVMEKLEKFYQGGAVEELGNDKKLKGTVLLVKSDFILVSLSSHGRCLAPVAYMPSRLELADQNELGKYQLLTEVSVRVEGKVDNSGYLVVSEENFQLYSRPGQSEEGETDSSTNAAGMFKRNIKMAVGGIYRAIVREVKQFQLDILIEGQHPGKIHISELTDAYEDGTYPLEKFKPMTVLSQVKVIGFRKTKKTGDQLKQSLKVRTVQSKVAECSIRHSKLHSKSNKKLSIGYRDVFKTKEVVPIFIHGVSGDKCDVIVNPNWKGRLDSLNISSDIEVLNGISGNFHPAQVFNAHILAVDSKSRHMEVSLLHTQEAKKISNGASVIGRIVGVSADDHVTVKLPGHLLGVAHLTDLCDNYDQLAEVLKGLPMGKYVQCVVVDRSKPQRVVISLRPSDQPKVGEDQEVKAARDPAIRKFSDVTVGAVYRGFTKKWSKGGGLLVSLGANVTGRIAVNKLTEFYVKDPETLFTTVTLVTVKVMSVHPKDGGKVELSMLPKDTGKPDQIPAQLRIRKRRNSDGKPEAVEKRKRTISTDSQLSVASSSGAVETKPKVSKPDKVDEDKSDEPMLDLEGLSWNDPGRFATLNLMNVGLAEKKPDEVDADAEETKPKVKKFEAEKLMEENLRKTELALMNNTEGSSMEEPADFDRLLMSDPNSSLVWVKYMAYCLQAVDVDKARAVGERALKTINPREEQHRLNVWIARLNLESLYGTAESLKEVLDRALQANDQLKVYQQMAKIHQKNGKLEEGDEMHKVILKKFRSNFQVWLDCCQYYMETKRVELARETMQRAASCLQPKEHINLICRVAHMEFRYGDKEKGATLFESVLSNFPKRTDIWFSFADVMTKNGHVDQARSIYERLSFVKLPVKRMRSVFKKWLEFEQKFGTADTVAQVKLNAAKYVEGVEKLDLAGDYAD